MFWLASLAFYVCAVDLWKNIKPRNSNTGFGITRKGFVNMNTEKLNGMTISVDWMSFTVFDASYTVSGVMAFLGFDASFFQDTGHGAMGYRSLQKLGGYAVSVLSDGREDMGIHVAIGGTAVAHVLHAFYKSHFIHSNPFDQEKVANFEDVSMDALRLFVTKVLEIGRFTRLDLALDDHKVHFTPSDIRGYVASNQVVSKFRSGRREEGFSIGSDDAVGDTLYLGSRKSNVMLRIYDKRLEQNAKCPEQPITTPWTRWEFEFSGMRAEKLAHEILNHASIGTLFFEVLNNYVRVVELTDSNRSRCPMTTKWAEFVACMNKLSLYCPPVVKTLEDKKQWIIRQVLPTLTGIIIADGGALDIIMDHWDESLRRMPAALSELISLAVS